MERAERNELEGTSIQEYPLFGEGWEAKPLSQPATIADYLDYLYHELAEGIRRQEENGTKTHRYIIDAAASLDVFRVAYRSCTEKGWIDHEHGNIPLSKREGALTAAHLSRAFGISNGRAEQTLHRLKERGEIRAAGAWQPSPNVYYTKFKHAVFDEPPAWALKLFTRGKKLFSAKTGTHEQQKIIEEYKAFWNSTEEKQEPTQEKQEPTEAEKSLENTAFSSPGENKNTDDYYNTNSITKVSVVLDSNKAECSPVDDKAVEEAPQASIQPPEINSMAWLKLYTAFGLMVRDCEDPAQKEQLTEFHHVMRNGATDERRAACSKLMAYRDRITAAAPARA